MKHITLTLIILMLNGLCLKGQAVLTLEECHNKAVVHYPTYCQYDMLDNSSELKIKNAGKTYLPEMNINGQASYQSDVTKVPTYIPAFAPPAISKDWYKLYLDVNQMIYDGGATRQNKELETLGNQIDRQNLDIELYQLKERVDQVFFGLLILQENNKLLDVKTEELDARLRDVVAAVDNGVLLSSNADVLRAEILKVHQKKSEIEVGISAGFNVLGQLIGEDIVEGTILQVPETATELPANGNARLEYGLFSLEQERMETMKKLSGSRLVPKFTAFGQAGYGRPALDMLNNNFTDFYIVGARLNWNFWNWNKTRNEKKILDISKQIVNTRMEAFSRNLSIDLENKRSEVIKYEILIGKDREIVDLHENIVKTYASQLENGVITATEYLTELNAKTEAQLNMQIHRIMLVQARYNYLSASGEL